MRSWLLVIALLIAVPSSAQQGAGNECTPAGTWYGGSVVAYQMTITPEVPAGQYTVMAQGMYKNSVMNTVYTGRMVKKGQRYEGSLMQLTTTDPDFLNPPPIGKMPDLSAGWVSMELVDCNTLTNTIPFFGLYFASGIWAPGVVWVPGGKVPLIDPPDVDLLNVISGGAPIVETYHRLSNTVNTDLLHQ